MLKTKRVYQAGRPDDGTRVLVDRLWPRGLSKADAHVDEWMKEVGPSDSLRKWFGHEAAKWPEFRKRYLAELESEDRASLVRRLAGWTEKGDVTLLFSAKDVERNNAVVLAEAAERIMEENRNRTGE